MIRCENPYCGTTENITRHHVLPKGYRFFFEKPKNIMLCRSCHTLVHQMKSNEDLAFRYNTRERVVQLFVEHTMPVEVESGIRILPIIPLRRKIRNVPVYNKFGERQMQMAM